MAARCCRNRSGCHDEVELVLAAYDEVERGVAAHEEVEATHDAVEHCVAAQDATKAAVLSLRDFSLYFSAKYFGFTKII